MTEDATPLSRLGAVAEALETLGPTTLTLADEVAKLRAQRRSEHAYRRLMLAGLFVMLLFMGFFAWMAAATWDNSARTRENTNLLRDCVLPGGECYTRSQQQTGGAVAAIVDAINAHTDQVHGR